MHLISSLWNYMRNRGRKKIVTWAKSEAPTHKMNGDRHNTQYTVIIIIIILWTLWTFIESWKEFRFRFRLRLRRVKRKRVCLHHPKIQDSRRIVIQFIRLQLYYIYVHAFHYYVERCACKIQNISCTKPNTSLNSFWERERDESVDCWL